MKISIYYDRDKLEFNPNTEKNVGVSGTHSTIINLAKSDFAPYDSIPKMVAIAIKRRIKIKKIFTTSLENVHPSSIALIFDEE